MDYNRLEAIVGRYPGLRVVVLGDFCLDRYLEIDPARQETSIETGLPVHNVAAVRAQPGGAGTIVNNLATLGATAIPVGFAGEDGEGFELIRALESLPAVRTEHLVRTSQRCTFTYCKPLVTAPGRAPIELNRFDRKNWTPTPALLQGILIRRLREVLEDAQALVVLDQVDVPETGVVTRRVLEAVCDLAAAERGLPILADCRRGLHGFPPVMFKMNAAELAATRGALGPLTLEEAKTAAAALAAENGRSVFVTLANQGIIGANANGTVEHVPALPTRGQIDVVGAGDAVSANLVAALAAGAGLREALELANAAASVVIHKLGTTGTASVAELRDRLLPGSA